VEVISCRQVASEHLGPIIVRTCAHRAYVIVTSSPQGFNYVTPEAQHGAQLQQQAARSAALLILRTRVHSGGKLAVRGARRGTLSDRK